MQLDAGGDNHSREWCYIDPASKVYKPEVRLRRVAQARARGIKIPAELDVDDKPSSTNLVSDLEAIVGLVGGAGEGKEALVDQLLTLQQGKEGGLYTTISHHDDGDLPQ